MTSLQCFSFIILISLVYTQEIVYDKLLDLCYWPKPSRAPTRCEDVIEIKVEKRLYDNTVPYWCIALDNRDGKYRTMTITYDGEKSTRDQDNVIDLFSDS